MSNEFPSLTEEFLLPRKAKKWDVDWKRKFDFEYSFWSASRALSWSGSTKTGICVQLEFITNS